MGKPTDIQVTDVAWQFFDERMATPLHFSRGVINEITYVRVTVRARTRLGQTAHGDGAIFLSPRWAFPASGHDYPHKDALMRALCNRIGEALRGDGEYCDPLQKGFQLLALLPDLMRASERQPDPTTPSALPYLAALNCLAPFDAAIHDAWGRALGGPVYRFYDREWLNDDLTAYLGLDFQELYPRALLGARSSRLAIQHVVSTDHALHEPSDESAKLAPHDLPQTLVDWIKRDGVFCFKVRTHVKDPATDGMRLQQVFKTATSAGIDQRRIRLTLDPNEACVHPDFLLEMLAWLETNAPETLQALEYIEQPTHRDLARYEFTMHRVAAHKSVIVDEALGKLDELPLLIQLGWSGLGIKTCRGQTHALLAYCWARRNNLFVTVQDLTNAGLALVHSANLAAQLQRSVDYFETNARQFAPHARPDEQARHPAYFRVRAGQIALPDAPGFGLY